MIVIAARDIDRYFTPEEYFAWEEEQLERHELIDGFVYAMSGGTQNHSAIKLNIGSLIKAHLRGSKCSVFNSDLKINILNTPNYTYPDLSVTCLNTPNYTYPDLSVTCDDRDQEDQMSITYPCLIVEVLSKSTEAYDQGKKFEKYRRNPNLIDYVLVSSEEIAIDIYHKNAAGEWLILSFRSGDRLELKSIDLSLPIEQFYEEIVFDSQSDTE